MINACHIDLAPRRANDMHLSEHREEAMTDGAGHWGSIAGHCGETCRIQPQTAMMTMTAPSPDGCLARPRSQQHLLNSRMLSSCRFHVVRGPSRMFSTGLRIWLPRLNSAVYYVKADQKLIPIPRHHLPCEIGQATVADEQVLHRSVTTTGLLRSRVCGFTGLA